MNIPVDHIKTKGGDGDGDRKLYIRFRELRVQHGETQESLAEKLGVNPQAVKAWEKHKGGSDPKLKNLLAMCDLYNCDLDYLVGRIEKKTHDIQTVCEITGLSEKAVEKITSVKPHRDLSDLLPIDYMEVNGKYVLSEEGRKKVSKKKLIYSVLVSPLSKLMESERFSGLILAYRQFLDSAERLDQSTLERPQRQQNDIESVVLSREDATRYYMRRVSDEIMFICEDEFKKHMTVAIKNEKQRNERMMEEEDPDDQQEDE